MSSQRQQGGDGSTNLQAQHIVVHQGITYDDAKGIARDVFRENVLVLVGEAQRAAEARVEELIEKFLARLQESGVSLEALGDPDVQHDLFTAQVGYARSGSVPLADTLVSLLVDRCSAEAQSIEALVLNEAIATLPKITTGQANSLTLAWMLRQAAAGINSAEEHGQLLEEHIGPLMDDLSMGTVDIQHLQYAGCLAKGISEASFHDTLTLQYGHIYARGFAPEIVTTVLQPYLSDQRFFVDFDEEGRLIRTASGLERALNGTRDLSRFMADEQAASFLRLNREYRESELQIIDRLEPYFKRIRELEEAWSRSAIRTAELTSVGIAIAHANAVRTSSFDGPLSIWIH